MIHLNMRSSAEKIKGQGVASAYRELINLLETQSNLYQLTINKNVSSDITHYHTVDPLFYLSTFSKKSGVKVGYVHFLPETVDESLNIPSPLRSLFYRYVISFYRRMDKLVVVNPSFISSLTAYGIKEDRIHYIPNFVSKQAFYPLSAKSCTELKQKQQFDDRFIVIGAGQVQHRKGVLDFVETAKQLPDVQFIWVGGFSFGALTSGYKELKEICEHPPANVHFTGIVNRDEMNQYFNMADVLFVPSFNELFPMTILEAMNCEKPLLLRDLTLYNDILFDFYLKGTNNEEFIQQIRLLKDDNTYYNAAKSKAIKGAEHYSEDRVLQLWNNFYSNIHSESAVALT